MAIIKVARLWGGIEPPVAAAPPSMTPVDVDPRVDSLEVFRSEAMPPAAVVGPVLVRTPLEPGSPGDQDAAAAPPRAVAATARRTGSRSFGPGALRWITVAVLSAAAAASGALAYQREQTRSPDGTLTIQTAPAGVPVVINSRPSGLTPLSLTLPAASYSVQVGVGAQRRELTVNLTAGSSILQHLEMSASSAPPAAAVAATGALRVQTDPPGQPVSVDGTERGPSPVTVHALGEGDHSVSVRATSGTVRKTVTVKAGETVSLIVSSSAPATPPPGWLSVQSSARLELREAGKVIGTTDADELMLPAGEHTIDLVNDTIGYRAQRVITVAPGKRTVVPVEMPLGTLSINALPWAEVVINGERVGETPIANLARRVGTHEIVFRHPELGEKRETVTVTLRQTARIGVDMRGK